MAKDVFLKTENFPYYIVLIIPGIEALVWGNFNQLMQNDQFHYSKETQALGLPDADSGDFCSSCLCRVVFRCPLQYSMVVADSDARVQRRLFCRGDLDAEAQSPAEFANCPAS